MTWKLLGAMGVVGIVGLVAWSGPILPNRGSVLPDEIRTTAGIQSLRLVIAPVPAAIRDTGVNKGWIYKDWSRRIEQAGIRVVDDPEAPALSLLIIDFESPSLPDAAGYCLILGIEQKVRIDRLAETFRIPTWTGVDAGMDTKNRLSRGLHVALKLAVTRFLDRSRTATALTPDKRSEEPTDD